MVFQPASVPGAVLASALPGEEQRAPGEEGHMAHVGAQGRLPAEVPSETQGAGQGKGVPGRRKDKTAWHLVRPTKDGVLLESQVQV